MTISIEKHWDGNVSERERNGRIYVSEGRWQWLLLVNGECVSEHDLRRQAVAAAKQLTERAS